jgi:kojibiose phosphorylase
MNPGKPEGWTIERTNCDPGEHAFYETLLCISNGFSGLRFTGDFLSPDSIPGFFLYGIYGYGLAVKHELVNIFNPSYWGLFTGGVPFTFEKHAIASFRQGINMRNATQFMHVVLRDDHGRKTAIEYEAFYPLPYKNILLCSFTIEKTDHDTEVTLCSGISTNATNGYLGGTEQAIRTAHLEIAGCNIDENKLLLTGINRSTKEKIHFSIVHSVEGQCDRKPVAAGQALSEYFILPAGVNKATIFKCCSFEAGDDKMSKEEQQLPDAFTPGKYNELKARHDQLWEERWKTAGIQVETSNKALQEGVRFGVFQLLQSPYYQSEQFNIPARALSSEYHSGHIFFNSEFYVIPYYTMFDPATAGKLIKNRIACLPASKAYAAQTGYKGARVPEEADVYGNQSAPFGILDLFNHEMHYELSGKLVKHLSADVIYSIDRYLRWSDDKEIIDAAFVEYIIEIARYCASLFAMDDEKKQYVINDVMCFDEFHYNVNNHFATNYLTAWALKWCCGFLEKNKSRPLVRDMFTGQSSLKQEMEEWEQVSANVYLPPAEQDGLIPQFDGYCELEDATITRRTVNMLPEITGNISGSMNALEPLSTRIIKQADVVFLLSLFPGNFSRQQIKTNFRYYDQRTVHASSLSVSSHAAVASMLGHSEDAMSYILTALRYNLDFFPREHYNNGIHLAGYAGAFNVIVENVIGFRFNDAGDRISLSPVLPAEWTAVSMQLHWKKYKALVTVTHNSLQIEFTGCAPGSIEIEYNDRTYAFQVTEEHKIFTIKPES